MDVEQFDNILDDRVLCLASKEGSGKAVSEMRVRGFSPKL